MHAEAKVQLQLQHNGTPIMQHSRDGLMDMIVYKVLAIYAEDMLEQSQVLQLPATSQ